MKFTGRNLFVSPNAKIGKNVRVGDNCTVYDGVEIGDNSIICFPIAIGVCTKGIIHSTAGCFLNA